MRSGRGPKGPGEWEGATGRAGVGRRRQQQRQQTEMWSEGGTEGLLAPTWQGGRPMVVVQGAHLGHPLGPPDPLAASAPGLFSPGLFCSGTRSSPAKYQIFRN